MLFSIITINKNNKAGLEQTIESAFNQTGADYEYIIIDGKSADGGAELIRRCAQSSEYGSKIAYWVSEEDSGVYNAMNKGCSKASGDYCLFLNSGDRLAKSTTLADCAPYMRGGADFYYGDALTSKNNSICGKYISPTSLTASFFIQSGLYHQATFIKRKILIERPYDENLKIVSDWKHCFICFLDGRRFERVNQCISVYDRGGISSDIERYDNEKNAVLAELIPERILSDLRRLAKLNWARAEETIKLIKPLYRFITKALNCAAKIILSSR